MPPNLTRSAKQFARELKYLGRLVGRDADKIIRKVIFDTYRQIVVRTPVDTGRAKANWSVANRVNEQEHTAGRVFIPETQNIRTEKTIFIFNNLEYIQALEDGHSQQAPQGMVALSLAEMAGHLRRETRSARYGGRYKTT